MWPGLTPLESACYRALFRYLGEGEPAVPNIDVGYIILFFVVFLFSLSVHESAHAFVSNMFGDDLGRSLGRITLNPVPHIDPFGTILFPLIGILAGGFMFGWAKPVPVN